MRKFMFRLQRVLDARAAWEDVARREFQAARAATLAAEGEIERLRARKSDLLARPALDLAERQALERAVLAIDDAIRHQKVIVEQCAYEEEWTRDRWIETRRDLQVMEKLRERDFEAYRLDMARREQAEMDEFGVLRRVA